MKEKKRGQIVSLNEGLYTDLPLEELDKRLKMEELDERIQCWTCSCDCDECSTKTDVDVGIW